MSHLSAVSQSKETSQTKNIAFVGSGNMASAIIGGLVNANWASSAIMATNPSGRQLQTLANDYNIKTSRDNSQAVDFADILVLAVKPQIMPEVCIQLSQHDLSNKLIISIAAGYSTQLINAQLKQSLAIVRAMPNTPALIAQGATGLFANSHVLPAQKQLAGNVFESVGSVNWIENEAHMDVVTAIAGSSPAYVFMFMQAMLEQAVESGLPHETAFDLITQSVAGAARLAQFEPQKTLQELRRSVTSPGGTTAAAINSFQNDDFESIIKKAVKQAIQRGRELEQNN